MSEIRSGVLEPSGQFMLTLKPAEQSATKADIAAVLSRLGQIESMLR